MINQAQENLVLPNVLPEKYRQSKMIKTIDGRMLDSYSEEYKMYCGAKHILRKFRVKRTRQKYLQELLEKKGREFHNKFRAEMLRIYEAKIQASSKG